MVEWSEFKGRPILVLKRNKDDQYAFSFGVSKARLILDHLEEIEKFVEDNG